MDSLNPLRGYRGSKARVANQVWYCFSKVNRYIEPFCGSAAVLFARPNHRNGYNEVLNDADGFVVNALRCMREDPSELVRVMSGPGSTADLNASIMDLRGKTPSLLEGLRTSTNYYEPKTAALWLYASNWSIRLGNFDLGELHRSRCVVSAQRLKAPKMDTYGSLEDFFTQVQARLARAVLLCGDWSSAVTWGMLTARQGHQPCGVFLDPPYSLDRRANLYQVDSTELQPAVQTWCIEAEAHPFIRVCVAGYKGEYETLLDRGWYEWAWSSMGGGSSRHRERLYFSPSCND